MYLLDTMVVSAFRLPERNVAATRWLRAHQGEELWISVFTIGEIQQGIELTTDVRLKRELEAWLDNLRAVYREWIIPFYEEEAKFWGTLVAPFQLAGRPQALVDSMIAAIALFHGGTVVTRNVKDFQPFDVPIINPWENENGA